MRISAGGNVADSSILHQNGGYPVWIPSVCCIRKRKRSARNRRPFSFAFSVPVPSVRPSSPEGAVLIRAAVCVFPPPQKTHEITSGQALPHPLTLSPNCFFAPISSTEAVKLAVLSPCSNSRDRQTCIFPLNSPKSAQKHGSFANCRAFLRFA